MSNRAPQTAPKPEDDEQRRRRIEFNQPAIALLRSWQEDESETIEEQREALFTLMRAIDEDRGSGRKLFQDLLSTDETHRRLG